MLHVTMNFPFRMRKFFFLCGILLLLIFYYSLPSGKQHTHITDMTVDAFYDDSILRRWGGYELQMAHSHQRFEHALYAVRKYGQSCDLNKLGVPKVLSERGCQGPLCHELTCKNLLLGSSTEGLLWLCTRMDAVSSGQGQIWRWCCWSHIQLFLSKDTSRILHECPHLPGGGSCHCLQPGSV